MKYIPSEETEEINYKTEKNPWLNVVVLVSGCVAIYFAFVLCLGLIGETLAVKIPPSYERTLFSYFDLNFKQKSWDLGNEIMSDIFQNNNIDEAYMPEVFLSCDDTVNAIALPGKKIIVFKGLLKDITSLNSLYFVLGHELGHVINRDHLRSIGRALAISVGLSFISIGGDSNSFFSLNQAIVDRQFSQNQESSSDERSIQYTAKRFKGLFKSHEFFDHILKKNSESKLGSFLSTHPMTQERIDKIKTHKDYNRDLTLVEPFDPKSVPCP